MWFVQSFESSCRILINFSDLLPLGVLMLQRSGLRELFASQIQKSPSREDKSEGFMYDKDGPRIRQSAIYRENAIAS